VRRGGGADARGALAILAAAAIVAGCASTTGASRERVAIGGGVEVALPTGFRSHPVSGAGGAGTRFRRYRGGRETSESCTFRTARATSEADPAVLAARLVEGQLDSARGSGSTDAAHGVESGARGEPERRYVTASFSLHSTIHADHSFWVWREGPELVALTRSCQSSDGAAARQALVDAFPPVFAVRPAG